MMKKTVLKEYARLIAEMGAHIEKGDEVRILAELDQPEFVAMLTEACYRRGAVKVSVEWDYQPLTKIHVKHRTLKKLSEVTSWEVEKLKCQTQVLPASIYLISEDPDGLAGMDQEKNAKASQARYAVIKPFRDEMENKYKWCIAAVPGRAWAKKMFPSLRPAQAIEKQWEAILYTSRVLSKDGQLLNAVEEWKRHNDDLRTRSAYLNSLGVESLHYTAANGTDLTVGLIDGANFCGGEEKLPSGSLFNPNIPSEECFTSPKRGVAEGIVYASMPLSWRGEIIDRFWIRFEGGKAVDSHAEVNDALLKQMLSMDEGAAYLGECALVPFESPIRQSGLTFYETLFDENATCHLAMGEGFTNVLQNYETMTLEQCREKGINDSMIHVDFMVGTEDLSITAHTRDGRDVAVFRKGTWAF